MSLRSSLEPSENRPGALSAWFVFFGLNVWHPSASTRLVVGPIRLRFFKPDAFVGFSSAESECPIEPIYTAVVGSVGQAFGAVLPD
jgi:hypothetical protein